MAELSPMLRQFGDGLIKTIKDFVGRRIAPIDQRVASLESRLQIIERRAIGYRGVYEEGIQYSAGDTATLGGALWYCRRTTIARPGASSDWQLMTKTKDR